MVCPSLGISTKGREAETTKTEISTLEDCSMACRRDVNCKFFTWFNKDSGIDKFKCVMMSAYQNLETDANAITADVNCKLGKFLSMLI